MKYIMSDKCFCGKYDYQVEINMTH